MISSGIGSLFVLLIAVIALALPIWATVRAVTGRSGVELVLWLILIWMVGIIGPIIALCVIRPNSRT